MTIFVAVMKKIILALMTAMAVCSCGNNKMIDGLIQKMTVREKVAQLIVMHTFSDDSLNTARFKGYVDSLKIGGLILQDRPDGLVHTVEWLNSVQRESQLPVLVTIDAEWGLSMRFDEFPELPRFTDIASMDNPEKVAYSVGKCIGQDMKDFNFHVNFSPVVDLNTNQSSVKSRRSFGNDYKKVEKYAYSMLKGLHDGGAMGCAKHFPGIGATQSDTHHQMVYTPLSREELEETHLKPFRYMSARGAEMIMIAHVIAESLDPEKVPSSISHKVITDILKGEMGYKGLVITDALQMHGVTDYAGEKNPALLAYEAGADLLLMPDDPYKAVDAIASAVESGTLSEKELDSRVRKMLEMKRRLGLFDRSMIVEDIEAKVAASVKRNADLNSSLGYSKQ